MADLDPLAVTIIVLLVVMSIVSWFELRYLRKSSKARRDKAVKRNEQLPDEAHNALVTTRAIIAALAERGVRSEELDGLMQEAQAAFQRKNYRVTVQLTQEVRGRLMTLKGRQQTKGDMAKLEASSSSASGDEPTTKEVLQKQFPPNLLPSKFAISMAESSIETGAGAGRDVSGARSLLEDAKVRFDAQDYPGALSAARLAQKRAGGESVGVPAGPAALVPLTPSPTSVPPAPPASTAVPLGSACPSCGAPMKAGDTFCRKCGAKAVTMNCPTCGAALLSDDLFCRKCGTRIPR